MARKGSVSTPVVQETGIRLFTSEDGAVLCQTPDGNVFTSKEEADAYMAENQVGMIVSEFMADVEANPDAYFANKKGEMPESDRALLAMKTRLRNNATAVIGWYLSA